MHTFAYSGSLSTTANVDVPAVVDDVLTISNNHFIIPNQRKLFVGYAGSATLSLAEINCAKFRQFAPIRLLPWNVGALPANNPNVFDCSALSINLPVNEELQAICSSAIASVLNKCSCFCPHTINSLPLHRERFIPIMVPQQRLLSRIHGQP